MRPLVQGIVLVVFTVLLVGKALGAEDDIYYVGHFACYDDYESSVDIVVDKIWDYCLNEENATAVSIVDARRYFCPDGGYKLVMTYRCED